MKKRILSILLALSMVVGGLYSLAFVSAAAGETFHVTVNAAEGGKVSTDGTNWSDSVVVPVAGGETLGNSVQYQADEGYKLDSVTTTTVIKKVVASDLYTAVIDDEGNLYTAGDNYRGQLGRKLDAYKYEDSVLTKVSTSAKITDVAAGLEHTVILDENGDVWTAGSNQYGALGTDVNVGKSYGENATFTKVNVGDGSVKIKAVAAGKNHTVLIDENGGVWTAGRNSDGELGRSDNVGDGTPNAEFKKADGLENVKIVSAAGGTAHTILLDEEGNIWTAGTSNYGVLGRQTADDSKVTANPTFEKVTDGISGVKITAIAAGSYHNVLLAEDGSVWTVGSNLYGELGREITGSVNSEFKQADLQGAAAAKFIAAYGAATVVIDTDGNARTCGINSGHLGRTVTGPENPELLVAANGIDNTKMTAAAMGTYHTVLLDENGRLWTCGKNQAGQLCRTENFGKYTSVTTFGAVTDGLTQTITFDEMKSTVITSGRAYTITSAVREKVRLEYDLNGGQWVDGYTPKDFAYKDEGLLLPDATKIKKPGYTFTGWETTDQNADPIKCSATWTANVYTVTFDANGGSEVITKTMTATYGEQLGDMPVPMRMGYFFRGWYDAPVDGKCYGNSDGKSTSQYDKTENCTLYAQWKINQYTIAFDTAGGSEIAPNTQDYGTAITAPAAPTREGYTFIGWDKAIPATMPAENITITAQWKINQYTITFDTAGGSKIDSITQDYGTAITAPADPTREGYTFIGWDKAIPETMPAENVTITARWKDSEKPTGEIKISENSWKTFLNNITFGLFFKDTQTVIITAADNSGEAVTVEYLLSAKELTKAELDGMTFTAYTAPFGIDPDNEYVVYVRLTDTAGNTDYICSEGIVLDGTSPVITGIENSKTYCEAQTVTITEKYVDTVTVNGTAVTLDESGNFVLSPADGEQKIVVTDKAGNTVEMTVTVNDGHTFGEWSSNGDGTHTRKCTVDGCNGLETEICSGGKATCKDKAICEVCGKSYGELGANNHADLTHIDAKAATKDAEGNIEYWYCDGCGKYYSDDAATKEITKAETITAKLKEDSQKDPAKTGDSNSLVLWIALLFVSGSVMTGVMVVSKKKKRFVR